MTNLSYAITTESSKGAIELREYSVTSGGKNTSFDAKTNVENQMRALAISSKLSDSLMYSAASALQRQFRNKESVEEWAERLSGDFFDDL